MILQLSKPVCQSIAGWPFELPTACRVFKSISPPLKKEIKTIWLRRKFIVLAHGSKVEPLDNLQKVQAPFFASSLWLLALLERVHLVMEGFPDRLLDSYQVFGKWGHTLAVF